MAAIFFNLEAYNYRLSEINRIIFNFGLTNLTDIMVFVMTTAFVLNNGQQFGIESMFIQPYRSNQLEWQWIMVDHNDCVME